MPKPPILDILNFKETWKPAKTYRQWLKEADIKEAVKTMEDHRKAQVLPPETEALLDALPRNVHVLVIAEDWCGDVHRHVPVLEKLTQCSKRIKTRYIFREEYPQVFTRFLTNGGEAIPKFIFLSDQFVECGNWGPMPTECRRIIARGKAAGDVGAARQRVGALYAADPHCEIVVNELVELIQTAVCTMP